MPRGKEGSSFAFAFVFTFVRMFWFLAVNSLARFMIPRYDCRVRREYEWVVLRSFMKEIQSSSFL